MESFNVVSTAAAMRVMPPLKVSSAEVTFCTLVASSDLDKVLDVTKEVTRGAGAPSVKMGGWPANIDGRPAMSFGRSAPLEVSRPTHVCEASPSARGHGPRLGSALSPHPTIRKEDRSVTPTRPTMGVLTPRKVVVRCNLVVHSGNSDDDLPLVQHDAWVDLNPDGVRIYHTQEPTLLVELPLSSPPPYIMVGWWMGVGCGKVLILNPNYKGKDHTESISSNPL
jgi:hypothetical protein